jgi:predicted DCC family thiol-disulfide oxidoreductase YuxK
VNSPVVLFDGVCNLCNAFVQFIIAHDPVGRFRFAPLQSDVARRLLGQRDAGGSAMPGSFVLVEGDRMFRQSTAALRIARGLGLPWRLAYGLVAVPRPLRDCVYDLVARHRYQWFGQRDVCMVPTSDVMARFLG